MRALVIDDSRVMRGIIRQILRPIASEVSEAGNGREGLERLRQLGRPDLILVDWNMPEMDGLTFVHAVRADPTYAAVPLVMVTTETEMDRVSEALNAGANEYVMKPFTQDALLSKLELLGFGSADRPLPACPTVGWVERQRDPPATTVGLADARPTLRAAQPRRVLVVDDARVMRRILRQLLEQAGCEVMEAADGREGLERLEQPDRPDLVLVDWNMPDMDGPTFIRTVRAAGCYGGVRLVMITGEAGEARAEALEAGADDFLVKPPSQESLAATLRRLALRPV